MRDLAILQWQARREIDIAAGEVRNNYMTDIFAQDYTYAVKLEQAGTYLAAFSLDAGAAVPAYISAEATATAAAAEVAATAIVDAAAAWNTGLGPQIEEARIAGKSAVTAAVDDSGVAVALAAALAALAAI